MSEPKKHLRSDISNIRFVYKFGAWGDPNAFGRWIYGKRPDGRTVPCKSKVETDGGFSIFSAYSEPGSMYFDEWVTEFTADEWYRIEAAPESERTRLANKILKSRLGK